MSSLDPEAILRKALLEPVVLECPTVSMANRIRFTLYRTRRALGEESLFSLTFKIKKCFLTVEKKPLLLAKELS